MPRGGTFGSNSSHGPLLPGPGHMARTPRCMGAAVNQSQGNSDCMLCYLGQTKFMPHNPDLRHVPCIVSKNSCKNLTI